MKLNVGKLLKLFLLSGVFLLISGKVSADETEALMKQVGFTYVINHPDNQIGMGNALNLKMKPGQKQQVKITISNSNDQNITLSLKLNGARTNGHGGLEYGPSKFKAHKSMVYDLPDLVKIPSEVIIPKQGKKDVELTITMPKVPFDGLVTGGVQMIEKETKSEDVTETGIVNKVAYLFGVTVQMTDSELIPELELEKVYAGQANFRNAIYLDLANIMAIKIKGLMLDVEIMKVGSEEVLYQSKNNNMEMAPNTLMSYPISLGGEKMIAGKYTAKILASAHGELWSWNKEFAITEEEAGLFNQKDVNIIQERGFNWQLVALIVICLLFIISTLYLLWRRVATKEKAKRTKKR